MRHAVGQYYAAATKVAMDGVVFVWQSAYHTLLTKFREACVRWALAIKLQYARRAHSNLTEGVAQETREEFAGLVEFNDAGSDFRVTPAFNQAVERAKSELDAVTTRA